MEFKVKSITVRIEFTFLLLLSFAVLYGYENAVQLIFFSLLHECGHLFTLLFFGVKPSLIHFSFYGMGIKYLNRLSNLQESIIILCGPMVNLILFFILNDELNLLLFLLNMFPASPLDGGRLLKIMLPEFSVFITYFFLFILFGFSFYLLLHYKIFSLMLITVYLFVFNISQMRSL